jgi:hypothetical protein
MSDCIEDSNDKCPDGHNAGPGEFSPSFAVLNAQSRHERSDVILMDDKRKAQAMAQLTDEFGQNIFVPTDEPRGGGGGSAKTTAPSVSPLSSIELTGTDDLAFRDRGLPADTRENVAHQAHNSIVERLHAESERCGKSDLKAMTSLSASLLDAPKCATPHALFQLQKSEQVGAQRCDQISDKLDKRNGDHSQEQQIHLMLSGVRETNELALRDRARFSKDDDREDSRASRPKKKLELEDELSEEDSLTMKFLFDGEASGSADSEHMGDWADSRAVAANLSDSDNAEQAMNDLVAMAKRGNPFARDLLGSCLAAGNKAAESAWLQARLSEKSATATNNARRSFIPNLPPHLADKIKAEAARALIDLGRNGLTKAEQIALSIGLGYAFKQIQNGHRNEATTNLLQVTAEHFLGIFDGRHARKRSQDQRRRRRTAMGALYETVKSGVPGFKQLARFMAQLSGQTPPLAANDEKTTNALVEQDAVPVAQSDADCESPEQSDPEPTPDSTPNAGIEPHSCVEVAAPITDSNVESTEDVDELLVGGTETDGDVAPDRMSNWSNKLKHGNSRESLIETHRLISASLFSGRQGKVRRETRAREIPVSKLLAGATSEHASQILKDTSITWTISSRRSLTITDSQTLVKLDSGRLYDPMTNRFFKSTGSEIVEDERPMSADEQSQVEQLQASENLLLLMNTHLILMLKASLQTTQFFRGRGLHGQTFVSRRNEITVLSATTLPTAPPPGKSAAEQFKELIKKRTRLRH